jgi:hypothetical protein
MVFQECDKGVARVSYKGAISVFQGCYKGVTRVSQECHKGVTSVS